MEVLVHWQFLDTSTLRESQVWCLNVTWIPLVSNTFEHIMHDFLHKLCSLESFRPNPTVAVVLSVVIVVIVVIVAFVAATIIIIIIRFKTCRSVIWCPGSKCACVNVHVYGTVYITILVTSWIVQLYIIACWRYRHVFSRCKISDTQEQGGEEENVKPQEEIQLQLSSENVIIINFCNPRIPHTLKLVVKSLRKGCPRFITENCNTLA